jgi:hypothetical protein
MTQKFFLKIDAESPDGEAVKCETQIKVACSTEMAVGILANLIKQDSNLKRLITEALLISIGDDITTESISDEEYAKRSKEEDKTDLDF